MAWLKRKMPDDRFYEYLLEADHTTIGRSPANSIVIDDMASSRKHCLIRRGENADWVVQDLGSSNGTLVNGEKIAEKDLLPGDVIRIGQTEFIFVP